MEKWEKQLRRRLEIELEDGIYIIGEGKFKIQTRKGGAIDYMVAWEEHRRGLLDQVEDTDSTYAKLTKEKLHEIVNDLMQIWS